MSLYNKLLILCLATNWSVVLSVEPLTSSLVGVLGAVGLGAIYSAWDYLKCSTAECCHPPNEVKRFVYDASSHWPHREPWIDYEVKQLDQSINTQVYGQHLAKNIITKLIPKHLKNNNPNKPLVLSFHGWTGGGKTFMSEIVAKNIYLKFRKSDKSNFVHRLSFTNFNTNDKHLMRQWIKDNVTNAVKQCPRSLFIFDEIDKLVPGVIDAIKPFIDYNQFADSIDYRKAIFIFLSNTGGTGITKTAYDFHLLGKERTDLTIKDLEPLMNSGAFNEDGGLYKSDIVEKNLIDAFVPFLPLEKKHIKMCIQDHLKYHYNKSDPLKEPGEEFIRQVSNELEYFPPDTRLYSKTGCKRVANKVDVLM
ncbi:torsin-1A-like [Oppia nitens]|uniref:torsin-1A-like n=1 Tax=Oppia nitens TaxID=1686743 RepID=UPI0023DC1D1C|nr:torsin-1A-like [Oppia nitens]